MPVIKGCGDPISFRSGHTSLKALTRINIYVVWLSNIFLKSNKNGTTKKNISARYISWIFVFFLNISWICLCLVLPWACLKVIWDTGDILVKKENISKRILSQDRVGSGCISRCSNLPIKLYWVIKKLNYGSRQRKKRSS